jgi:hypothetical protein
MAKEIEQVPEVPDVEVARYALRTFKLNFGGSANAAQTVSVSSASTWGVGESPPPPAADVEPVLTAVVMAGRDHWKDGTATAKCMDSKDHESPSEGCNCGIYGTLTMQHLVRQYRNEATNIVAVFAAEGKTIIGDRGLRTAYARVLAYWTNEASPAYKEAAQRQFKDAKWYETRQEMLAAFDFPHYEEPKPMPLSLNVAFIEVVPDKDKSSSWSYTVHTGPGNYTEVVLTCGHTMPLTPPVILESNGQICVTLNWTPD